MHFLCECRGPCRRSFDLTPEIFAWLRKMGAVVAPECAERERREIVFRYNEGAVVVSSNIPRVHPPER